MVGLVCEKGLSSGLHPTLSDETAKDGAPERYGLMEGKRFALCANVPLMR